MGSDFWKRFPTRYNETLREAIIKNNERYSFGDARYIYSVFDIQASQFGIKVIRLKEHPGVGKPHLFPLIEDWALKSLMEKRVEYRRSIEKVSPLTSLEMTMLINASVVQRGACVGYSLATTKTEIHPLGNELLYSMKFDALLFLVPDISPRSNTVDMSKGRLFHFPNSDRSGAAILLKGGEVKESPYKGKWVGHFAPNGIFLMEVVLPWGTNDERLDNFDEVVMKEIGPKVPKHNKILFSHIPEEDNTVGLVKGEAPCKGFLERWEKTLPKF